MQIEVYDALVHYKFSINRRFSVLKEFDAVCFDNLC